MLGECFATNQKARDASQAHSLCERPWVGVVFAGTGTGIGRGTYIIQGSAILFRRIVEIRSKISFDLGRPIDQVLVSRVIAADEERYGTSECLALSDRLENAMLPRNEGLVFLDARRQSGSTIVERRTAILLACAVLECEGADAAATRCGKYVIQLLSGPSRLSLLLRDIKSLQIPFNLLRSVTTGIGGTISFLGHAVVHFMM